MNAHLVWSNLLVYSAQIAIVAIAAAALIAILRLREPAAKLLYWHVAIAACVILPALRPWKVEILKSSVTFSSTVVSVGTPSRQSVWALPSFAAIMLMLVAAGVLIRLCAIVLGLYHLRRYRLQSRPCDTDRELAGGAELCISADIASPVTFGWRRPVILLPPRFADLSPMTRRAILCHEVFHVCRHDWLWTICEEMVRAAFWFHPAVWWMLGEAQLAREQAVDRMVIERTGARDEYLDALLRIADASRRLDLAPAPLFLKRRHLKQRVVSIVKEVRMSKTRLVSTFAAGTALLAGVCWMVTGALPLTAAPQDVRDGPGVTVQAGAMPLMHRAPVMYPEEAIAKGVQGSVVVQARLGSDGSVVDASVVSGPDELRKAALESVLNWHFDKAAAGSTQQVTIDFALPNPAAAADATNRRPIVMVTPRAVVRTGGFSMSGPIAPDEPKTVKAIEISGVSDQAQSQLLSQLPVKEGDTITLASDAQKITAAARAFDSHLMVSFAGSPEGLTIAIRPQQNAQLAGAIALPSPLPPFPGAPAGARAIRVGGNVQQTNLMTKVTPVYPPEAKAERVQGLVRFEATIGPDGHILNLSVISGPPLLVNSAMEAVKQWVYRPTLLNGNPTTVITTIDVNYTLAK